MPNNCQPMPSQSMSCYWTLITAWISVLLPSRYFTIGCIKVSVDTMYACSTF